MAGMRAFGWPEISCGSCERGDTEVPTEDAADPDAEMGTGSESPTDEEDDSEP